MMVYRGTTEIIEKPDVAHSKKYLDFGKGFYLTSFESQAKKWAIRKGLRQKMNNGWTLFVLVEKVKILTAIMTLLLEVWPMMMFLKQ